MKNAILFESKREKILEKGELYNLGLKQKLWKTKQDYINELNAYAVEKAKEEIKKATTRDVLISKAVNTIDELNEVINKMYNRICDWASVYYPEAIKRLEKPEELKRTFIPLDRREISKKLKMDEKSMGIELTAMDKRAVDDAIILIQTMIDGREKVKSYVEGEMKEIAPNVAEVAGGVLGAKLLSAVGGLEHLAGATASKIQVIGAEKAMFRHLKQGAKPPKYGVIMHHPLISEAGRENKGKLARTLAAKLSICAKVDYYSKGKMIAKEIKKELEERAKRLK